MNKIENGLEFKNKLRSENGFHFSSSDFSYNINGDRDIILKKSQASIDHFLNDTYSENGNVEDLDKIKKSVEHALRRSIRGVGSSFENNMAENYINLVSILRYSPPILSNLDTIYKLMEMELSPITNSNRDRREVKTGKLFVMSAILAARRYYGTPNFDLDTFIEKVISLSDETIIFKCITYKIFRQMLFLADDNVFKENLLPYFIREIKKDQKNTFAVFLFLLSEERFPHICTRKVIKDVLGSKVVLSKQIIKDITDAFKGHLGSKLFSVVNSDLCRNLVRQDASLENLEFFWNIIDDILSSGSHSVDLLGIIYFTFVELVENMSDISQILTLLTRPFVTILIKPPKNKNCFEKWENSLQLLFSALEKQKDVIDNSVLISIVERLLIYPGDFSFETSNPGKLLIQQIISIINKKGVKLLATALRKIILGTTLKEEFKDGKINQRPWQNKERLYAVHFLNRLLRHPRIFKNQKFKIEQLIFLTDIGFVVNPSQSQASASGEFAKNVRETIYRAVAHRMPSLSDFQIILMTIVNHIDSNISQGSPLRVKVTDDMKNTWKNMMNSIQNMNKTINGVESDEIMEPRVAFFLPMFLHLGLLLFKETNFAMDCLKELQEVYHRSLNNPEYDQWTGDLLELLLSLQSRHSQRHLIKSIFSHLCQHLTSENIIAILQVLDPRADSNPLVTNLELKHEDNKDELSSDSENDSSEEENNEDDSRSESHSDESSENEGEEMPDIDDEDETATDRLRQAVRAALGEAGVDSDNESIDIDQMDEEEGKRVDKALAKAFAEVQSSKQNKDKKQLAADRALLDFRLRVIDLLDVWLNTECAKLDDILDVLLTLLHLYEVSIMDRKQTPLIPRIRACLKKLTSSKKVSDVENVSEKKLAEILTLIVNQENKSSAVCKEMKETITGSTLMVLRIAKKYHTQLSEKTKSSPVLKVIMVSLDNFFTQRNCPLLKGFFTNILNTEWICNWYIADKLLIYAFGNNVRLFKQSEALDLLTTFFNNKRLLQNNITKGEKSILNSLTARIYDKANLIISKKINLPQKFSTSLQLLTKSIYLNKIDDENWKHLYEGFLEFNKPNSKKKENDDERIKGEVFNLSVTPEPASFHNNLHIAITDNGTNKTVNNREPSTKSLKKRKNSSIIETHEMPEQTNTLKTKKRKKKNQGKINEEKNKSKKLRVEAGSEGLIDGCFSNIRLPLDVTFDEEGNFNNLNDGNEINTNSNQSNGNKIAKKRKTLKATNLRSAVDNKLS
uniref:Uncharacterized protein n=1 Tax=Clastoptera arizonana TaxID=38151 RepID=A0A1B6DM61_9HEMI